jgi:hypothetical protein
VLLVGGSAAAIKIVLVLLAVGAAALLFSMLRQEVDEWIAFGIASLLLFTQVWFSHANLVLTDVASAALTVAAFHFFYKEKYLITGIICALAFLTRFPAGLAFISVLGVAVWQRKKISSLVLGFGIPVLVWTITNYFIWRSEVTTWWHAALRPLLLGFTTAAVDNPGLYTAQPGFYVLYFATKIPILLFGLFGLWYIRKHTGLLPAAVMAVCALVFFEWLPNDQYRFAILFIPGLLMLSAVGLQYVRIPKSIVYVAIGLSLFTALIDDVKLIRAERVDPPAMQAYYQYLTMHPVNGTVLVTDPVAAWYISNKALPGYYGQFSYLEEEIDLVNAVLYQPQHVTCSSVECEQKVANIQNKIQKDFKPVFFVVHENNTQVVYVRQ